jgi:RecA-family ATPase
MPDIPTDWLVDGLLPSIGTSIWAAPPKTAKSTILRQLSAFVSIGIPFLGRDVKQGGSLYFSTQERAIAIASHFRALGCIGDTFPLVIAEEQFSPKEALLMLDNAISRNPGLRLVVIDMICEVLPLQDTSDYAETSRTFSALHLMAERHKLHIAVSHHSKKAHVENLSQSLIGSSAIAGSVDQIIGLTIDSKQRRFIQTAQRQGVSLALTQLEWDAEKRSLSLGRDVEELKASEKKDQHERVLYDLLLWMIGHPECEREKALDGVRGDVALKRRAFNELLEEGQIAQSGIGRKGSPFTYTVTPTKEPAALAA